MPFGLGRRRAGPPLVHTLLVETTWRCNAACRFCYNHWAGPGPSRPSRPEPRTRVSRKILQAAIRGSGCRAVAFTGGESTLRDDLPDLVAAARLEGVTVSVLTNGSLLDAEAARDLARVGCGLVQLTFCGVEPAAHDALCGEGSFEKTMAALDAVRSAGLGLGLTFVVTRQNLDQAAPFVELAQRAGQREVLLNRWNPGGRGLVAGMGNLLPTLAELEEMLAAVDAAAAEARCRPFAAVPIMPCLVSWSRYPRIEFARGCAAGTRNAYFTVDPWGSVRFCNHTPTVLGNVLESPFEAIAASPKLTAFREVRPPFCVACPGWDICRGGCRAAAQQATGRADVEDPLLRACLDRGEIVPPAS